MRSENEHIQPLEGLSYRELRLLEEVGSSPQVSQRQLAHQVGVALGVANLLVRNLAKKGYIKVSQVGWKRWVYVLTPSGVARKVQLTFGYIERFLDHYKRVRFSLHEQLSAIPLNQDSRIAIYGTNEIAELVYLALRDMNVGQIEIFDDSPSKPKFLGMHVGTLKSLVSEDYMWVILTSATRSDATHDRLIAQGTDPSRIVVPLDTNSGNGAEKREKPNGKLSKPGGQKRNSKNGKRNGSSV